MKNVFGVITKAALIAALSGATAVPALAESSLTGTCSAANVQAALVPGQPIEKPIIAQDYNLSGTAIVAVGIDEAGKAQTASIVTSSGWSVLDLAARKAVMAQNFTPEIRACRNVGGVYGVAVVF